ncbi:uncharacterized protein [Physcomitrium patens]|uniref:Terpene cyclase/mutase family member n=1 Tax=Physcomitrium patens TaxID=3218 RepID=A0A7I3ZNJ0_PHYPA|nr:uncharacterized protein LOC112278732 [Physcomitrium patens]|eukprot:XP_024368189.1 uncharacterized protein LOC112278732 [Physcomitrella patens]
MGHAHEDSPELPAPEVDDVIRGAVEWSFREQHERGYWVGTLESCCQLEVEFLMCLHVLGIEPSENKLAEAVVRRVRAKQRADGAWDIYPGAPAGDINTTIESYIALKLHGARVEEPAMAAARAWILAHGGISHRVRTFTKLWLALLGEWSWDDVPCLPPELIFLPHWAPFSVYQFSYWARQVIVPMAILCVRRPVHPLPAHLRCRELIRENELSSRDLQPSRKMVSFLDGILRHVDNALRWYGERCLVKPGRATAVECCVAWVLKRQECDGSWPVTTGWFLVLMALKTEGFPLDHPVMRSGVAAFDTVAAETEHGTIIQPGTSPTWDTVLTLLSMLDCGVDVRDARFARGVEYILSKEVRSRSGDWSLKVAPTVAASGWYFYHENEMYPDVDDTAVAMTVLLGVPRARVPRHGGTGNGRAGARAEVDHGDGQSQRRVGRVRQGQHQQADHGAPVLRLRRGAGRAVCGRHGACRGDAGPDGAHAEGRAGGQGRGVPARGAGGRWQLVWPLGRQLRVRCGRRAAGAAGRGRGHARRVRPARMLLAALAPEPGWRLGRVLRLVRRPAAARCRPQHRVPDCVGTHGTGVSAPLQRVLRRNQEWCGVSGADAHSGRLME